MLGCSAYTWRRVHNLNTITSSTLSLKLYQRTTRLYDHFDRLSFGPWKP